MVQRTIVAALLALAFATPVAGAEGGLEIFPGGFDACLERDGFLAIAGCVVTTLPRTDFGHLLALFVLLILPVNRLVITPLLGVLEERTTRIEGARKRAGEVGAQADGALARYGAAVEEARKQAGELRKDALERARGDQVRILAGARHAAEAEVAAARHGMAGALAEARDVLRAQSEGLAREAAARVLGRPLS